MRDHKTFIQFKGKSNMQILCETGPRQVHNWPFNNKKENYYVLVFWSSLNSGDALVMWGMVFLRSLVW